MRRALLTLLAAALLAAAADAHGLSARLRFRRPAARSSFRVVERQYYQAPAVRQELFLYQPPAALVAPAAPAYCPPAAVLPPAYDGGQLRLRLRLQSGY